MQGPLRLWAGTPKGPDSTRCVVGRMGASTGAVLSLSLTPEPHNATLFGKRVFAGVVKGSSCDERITWSIWVGPTSDDRCPYKCWVAM